MAFHKNTMEAGEAASESNLVTSRKPDSVRGLTTTVMTFEVTVTGGAVPTGTGTILPLFLFFSYSPCQSLYYELLTLRSYLGNMSGSDGLA
jgi:hypothetical protein